MRMLRDARPDRRAHSSADCSSTTSPCSARCSAAASSSTSLPARTSISWISGSPTTKRRAGPTATATFIASRTAVPPGVTTSPTRSIVSCIASAARRRARAVVAVDPARDRVAAEVDDVAAVAVELRDDRVEDAVQVRRQLLGAALRAELGGQRLGERREAGDVREERRPGHPVRKLDAGRERAPPVPRDVRLGVVEGSRRRGRRPTRSPQLRHGWTLRRCDREYEP